MAYTWAQFQAAVIALITDKTPDETGFTEGVAEYVRARVASELVGNGPLYTLHENRYRALRRRLAGFQTTQNDATLQAAVRTVISDIAVNDTTFAYAVSLWCKAHIALEVDRNAAMHEQWMGRYREQRLKLLGYQHALAGGLQVAVEKFLPVDKTRMNVAGDFLTTHITAAVLDLQGLNTWFAQQVALVKADLQGLNERIRKEITNAVLDLQHYVPGYRTGQVSTYAYADVTDDGFASTSILPEKAEIREAWIVYPTDDAIQCHRTECVLIPWEHRFDAMICSETSVPQLAIDRQSGRFYVTPLLAEDGATLELVWDGKRNTFGNDDAVPYDEGAVKASAFYTQSELAIELGDPINVSRSYRARYESERTNAYLTDQRRRGVRYAKGLFPTCGGCSRATSSGGSGGDGEDVTMDGYELFQISAGVLQSITYSARLRGYKLRIELAAGAEPYTANFNLMATSRIGGHEIEALIGVPASTNPTLHINDALSGNPLVNFTHDGVAGWFNARFVFDGSNWKLFSWTRVGGA